MLIGVPTVPSLDVGVIVTESMLLEIAVSVIGVVPSTGAEVLTLIVLGSFDDHVTVRWAETSVPNESISCAVAVIVTAAPSVPFGLMVALVGLGVICVM